jgi:hypothetical protein
MQTIWLLLGGAFASWAPRDLGEALLGAIMSVLMRTMVMRKSSKAPILSLALAVGLTLVLFALVGCSGGPAAGPTITAPTAAPVAAAKKSAAKKWHQHTPHSKSARLWCDDFGYHPSSRNYRACLQRWAREHRGGQS